jgi:aryl-alcohol dehydrogenase-like predicted oxidoreductase
VTTPDAQRSLGRTGIEIAPLVFGGNVFGWTVDERTSGALLDRFFDAGLNAIDTADAYSKWAPGNRGGESETLIGRWLKARPGRRKDVVVITKVGSEMGPSRKGLSARHILAAAEDSLRRLQTDYIDVYLSHFPDPDALPAFGRWNRSSVPRSLPCRAGISRSSTKQARLHDWGNAA